MKQHKYKQIPRTNLKMKTNLALAFMKLSATTVITKTRKNFKIRFDENFAHIKFDREE